MRVVTRISGLLLHATLLCFLTAAWPGGLRAQTCDFTWADGYGDAGDDRSRGISVDQQGDILTAGSFEGSLVIGANSLTSAGGTDGFVARYEPDGTPDVLLQISGTGADVAYDVAGDASAAGLGAFYVAGSFEGTITLGVGADERTLTSNGGKDVFLAKYRGNATLEWAVSAGGASEDEAVSVAVTDQGDAIAIGGYFSGASVDFGNGVILASESGSLDGFVAVYDASGNCQGAQNIGGDDIDFVAAVDFDGAANLYAFGAFRSLQTVTPAIKDNIDQINGTSDAFLVKYTLPGPAFSDMHTIASPEDEIPSDLVCDETTGIYMTYNSSGSLQTFENSPIFITNAGFFPLGYLVKADDLLEFQWAEKIADDNGSAGGVNVFAEGVALDVNNNPVVTGSFSGDVIFDETTALQSGDPVDQDVFVARYAAADGALQFVFSDGGDAPDKANDIIVDALDDIYVAGEFNQITLGCTELTTNGGLDGFVGQVRCGITPLAFNVSDATDVTTPGGADGTITLLGSGGVPPYEYSIDGGLNFQTDDVYTGLTAGTYDVVVRDEANCEATVQLTINEPAGGSCPTPGGLAQDASTQNSITASWTDVTEAAQYVIEYRIAGSGDPYTSETINANPFEITGLTASTTYEVRVQSDCTTEQSPFSSSVEMTTAGTCATPVVDAFEITAGGATVFWDSTNDEVGFRVRYRATGAAEWADDVLVLDNELRITGLVGATDYEVEVKRYCDAPDSSAFGTATFTTDDCPAPSALVVSAAGLNTADLTWTAPATAPVSYTVRYKPQANATFDDSVSVTGPSASLTGLVSGTDYDVEVYAVCDADGGSSAAIAATLTTAACTAPASLTVSAFGDGFLAEWEEVPGAPGYELDYKLTSASTYTTVTTSETEATVLNLTLGQNYDVRVRATCGPTENSPYVTAVVELPTCQTPDGVTVTEQEDGLLVDWNSTGSIVLYYLDVREVGGPAWSQTFQGTADEYLLRGLEGGKTYEFRLRAQCLLDGAFSGFVTTTRALDVCPVPQNVIVCSFAPDQSGPFTVSWTPVDDGVSYVVGRQLPDATFVNSEVVGNIATIGSTGLQGPINARVQALCTGGVFSDYSGLVESQFCDPNCETPENAVVEPENITETTALVEWEPVTGAVGYEIGYRLLGQAQYLVETTTSPSFELTDLISDQTYQFRVRAVCLSGNNSGYTTPGFFATATPNCDAPTDPVLVSRDETTATVSWTASPDAIQYVVFWRPVGATSFTEVLQTATTFDLTGLSADVSYQVLVRSQCGPGLFSDFTDEVIVPEIGTCDQVGGFIVSNVGETTADVSWTAVAGAVSYRVEYKETDETEFESVTTTGTSVILTGLDDNTLYEARVVAVCSDVSESEPTSETIFQTETDCDAPENFSVAAVGVNAFDLEWDAVPGAFGYEVGYKRVDESTYTTTEVTGTNFSASGLDAATAYDVRVRTICTEDEAFSEYATSVALTLDASDCPVPANIVISPIDDNSAAVAWTGTIGAAGYALEFRAVGDASFISRELTQSNDLLEQLNNTDDFELRIKTRCSVGVESDFSTIITFNLDEVCSPPSQINVSSTATTAEISWPAVAGAEGYIIEWKPEDNTAFESEVIPGGTTTQTILTDLIPNTVYNVRLSTDCGALTSAPSNERDFMTDDPGPCEAPEITGVVPGTETAAVSWLPRENAVAYSIAWQQIDAGDFFIENIDDPAQSSFVIHSLDATSIHRVIIRSICADATSDYSDETLFSTVTTEPCVPPSSFSVTNVTTTTATINWLAVPGATGYFINWRRVGQPDFTTEVVTDGAETSFILGGLAPDSEHEIEVLTRCEDLQASDTPGLQTFTTPTNDPCVSSVDFIVSPGETTAVVDWLAVPQAVGYTIAYRATGASAFTTVNISDGATTTRTLTGLAPNTTYDIQMQVVCPDGPGAFTPTTTFTTQAASDCAVPAALQVDADETSALISWSGSANAFGYVLGFREQGETTFDEQFVDGATSRNITGLTPNTVYEVVVRALCDDEQSAFTNVVAFTTDGQTANCETPVITQTLPAENAFFVEWAPVTGATGYRFQWRFLGASVWTDIVINDPTITFASAFGLAPNTTIQYRVRTECGAGSSDYTAISELTTGDAECSAPATLTVSPGFNTAIANWTSVPTATSYTLQWRANGFGTRWTNIRVTGTTFTLRNLLPGTDYEIRIRSECGTESSDFTETSFSTTGARQSSVEAAARDLSVYPNPNTGRFHVRFTADASADLTLKLTDLSGRSVWTETRTAVAGDNRVFIDAAEAPAGVYLLEIRGQEGPARHVKVVLN